jgi:hypothetical protein
MIIIGDHVDPSRQREGLTYVLVERPACKCVPSRVELDGIHGRLAWGCRKESTDVNARVRRAT